MTGDVIADINYFSSTTDGCPPWVGTQATSAKMKSNLVQVPVPVTIQNLRDKEINVNLDANGFELMTYNGSMQEEFEQDSEAQKNYYEEISELLKKRLGASRVIIYHYAFRFRSSPLSDEQCNQTHRNPALYPHVDLSCFGIPDLLERELGKEESEKVKKNRIQVINLWRPLGPNPVTQKPLAMCDYLSIDIEHDVHQFTFYGLHENHISYTLSRNDQNVHMWYYMSQMRSDEMFIFKTFDSKPDVAQYAFHTAFKNVNEPTPTEEQKSLELRCLVFYDE